MNTSEYVLNMTACAEIQGCSCMHVCVCVCMHVCVCVCVCVSYLGTDSSPLADLSGLQRRVTTACLPLSQEAVAWGELTRDGH